MAKIDGSKGIPSPKTIKKYMNTLTAKIFSEQMFGVFFIKSPKILVNNFGEKGF